MTAATLERPRAVQHHYEPRGAAKQIFECRRDEVLVSGPAGTGKSRACLEKLHFMCLLNPGMRALIVRKTMASLTSTGLVTWREKVAKEGLAHGVLRFYGGSREEPPQYRYANGSVVVIGGLDKATKIMSSEYDVIFVQEATECTKDDWESLTTRLRNGVVSFQQLLADCNPSSPNHWLKARADLGDVTMIYGHHEDNPLYFTDDGQPTAVGAAYLAKLDKLTGVRKQRLRYGRWAAAEGLVYEDFDPDIHLVDALPDGAEHWTRSWAVDFGYNNPFVLQWWAHDPDGALWLYREIYHTHRLVEDHAKQVLSLVRKPRPGLGRPARPEVSGDWVWTEPKPRSIVADHDAEDRATLERHLGLSTTPATKTVKDGIKAVQSRLKVDERGKSRIYIVRDCRVERDETLAEAGLPTCTAEEITGYVWPQGVKPDQRDNPVKENDHGMDGARYKVAECDLVGRPRIRVLG